MRVRRLPKFSSLLLLRRHLSFFLRYCYPPFSRSEQLTRIDFDRFLWPLRLFFTTRSARCVLQWLPALATGGSAPCLAQERPVASAFVDYLGVYQRLVSAKGATGGRCPTFPNCSRYAVLAFQRYAPATAFALTTDRLMRCGRDARRYELTFQNGRFQPLDFPDPADNAPHRLAARPRLYARSDSTDRLSAGLKFATYLMNKGLHPQALLELNRLIYAAPDSASVMVYVNYLTCLRAVDETETAIYEHEVLFPARVRQHPAILTEVGNAWVQLKNYRRSRDAYAQAQALVPPGAELHDKLTLLRGVAYAREYRWDSASAAFGRVPVASFYGPNAQRNRLQAEKGNALRLKKPAVASALAVVPGLGYLYTGNRQTALAALVINGLFGWATYSSFERRNYGLGALVGAVSLGFYVGNIQGAARSARRHNDLQREKLAGSIRLDVDNR